MFKKVKWYLIYTGAGIVFGFYLAAKIHHSWPFLFHLISK